MAVWVHSQLLWRAIDALSRARAFGARHRVPEHVRGPAGETRHVLLLSTAQPLRSSVGSRASGFSERSCPANPVGTFLTAAAVHEPAVVAYPNWCAKGRAVLMAALRCGDGRRASALLRPASAARL